MWRALKKTLFFLFIWFLVTMVVTMVVAPNDEDDIVGMHIIFMGMIGIPFAYVWWLFLEFRLLKVLQDNFKKQLIAAIGIAAFYPVFFIIASYAIFGIER